MNALNKGKIQHPKVFGSLVYSFDYSNIYLTCTVNQLTSQVDGNLLSQTM